MPQCQGCLNRRGEEGAGKGKRYYVIPDGKRFPEKRELAQKWLHNLGRGHTVDKFTFGKHKVVCEDHFRPEAFLEDIRAALDGGETPKITQARCFTGSICSSCSEKGYYPVESGLEKNPCEKGQMHLCKLEAAPGAIVTECMYCMNIASTSSKSSRTARPPSKKKDTASTSSKSARTAPPPSKKKSVITKRCDAQTQTDIVLCDAQCQTTDPNMDVNIIAMYTDHAYAKRQCEGGQLITIVSLAAGVGC
ncbi:hypothetical protein BSL78_20311 [Apostichopus japonicus]|uniref:THAP-type domain-containing protein n=1 Tax=Stichopus japonicus TaxID=307972 RepID=A0A2G8K4A9_STIJA|nr:hypothetical protein BSL78_20311 [Apostichopus japonicus]